MELEERAKKIADELVKIISDVVPDSKQGDDDKTIGWLRKYLQYPLIKAYFEGIKNSTRVQLGDEESCARLREKIYHEITLQKICIRQPAP